MKLYCVLIFAAILFENDAKVHETDAMREQRAAADIARFIHLIHQQADDEPDLDERSEPPQSFAEDYFMVRAETPVKTELIQNSGPHAHSVRLHFIKNPKVLEDYKKRIKYRSSKENGDTFDNDLYNSDRRRSALFRLGSSSMDTALRTKSEEMYDSNRPENKKHDKRNNDRNGNNIDIYLASDEVRRKKRKGDTQNNAWDVITKKYNWDKPKQHPKKKKKKMEDDWDQVTMQNFESGKITTKKRGRDVRVEKPKKIDWGSAERQPKKDIDRSYEQKTKKKAAKDRDADDPFKTTKQWKPKPKTNRNKPYVPNIPSYDKPRKKSREHFDGPSIFGRTPIPYVGRHGIYAD